jgi:MFS family permease
LAIDGPVGALRLPAVRLFFLGRVISVLGAQMVDVAVGWQLYERTHSPLSLGLVGLSQVIPVVLLALPAGAAADRFDRRRMGMIAQGGLSLCALGLALAAHLVAPIWCIYCLLFLTGLCGTFSRPATSSLLAQIVPREQFANANAWLSSGFQLGATAGPALGGLIIALTGGAQTVFFINAFCALIFVGTLAAIPPTSIRPLEKRAGDKVQLSAGLHFVFKSRVLLPAITLDLFAVLLGGATALLPVYAKDILHVGASGLGLLRAAPSVGATVSALVQTRLPPWKNTGKVLLGCVAIFGIATVGFGLSRWMPLSLLCLFTLGGFDNVSAVIRSTLEQVVSPDALRGRIAAIHWVFIGLSNEMGEFESGLAASLLGTVPAVVLGGAGTIAVVIAVRVIWPELWGLKALEDARDISPA